MTKIRRSSSGLLLILMLCLVWPASGQALTARDLYYKAQNCYQQLQKNTKGQKYRDNWLRCIDRFKDVYQHDPAGPWAAAGLYMVGKLYQQLYTHSYKPSDQREALDSFERVVKRFPHSRYKPKAQAAIKKIGKPKAKSAAAPSSRPSNSAIRSQYADAEACYQRLAKSPSKRRYRENWLKCIAKFKQVHRSDPAGPWAAAGLFRTAEMYRELHAYSNRNADRQTSRDYFQQIVENYPDSIYHSRSVAALKKLPATAARTKTVQPKPEPTKSAPQADAIADIIEDASAPTAKGRTEAAPAPGTAVTVDGLRFWSNPNYTRVVIDANHETDYSHRLLKKDPEIHKPQRLYVDLSNSRLKPDLERQVPINDDLLTHVRAGQYQKDAVRVVVDIKSFKHYKIFSLKNPFRIVIDVWGHGAPEKRIAAGPPAVPSNGVSGSLAKQLSLGVSRIVIDPGHGGRDYGAPGYYKGVHEKYITLAIGKRLAQKIRSELQCEVVMTRDRDRYLSLEERTAIANTKNADLFISIHTNAARDRRAYGIETFFLNLATDDEAILVAARENATSTKNISDLQTILNDLMQNAKINESSRLAAEVQIALYKTLKGKYSRIKSKGVKQAPFYVLLGAQMPSILIETSFISNPRECKRLKDPHYQDVMCNGIIAGIKKYIHQTNPSAFLTSQN